VFPTVVFSVPFLHVLSRRSTVVWSVDRPPERNNVRVSRTPKTDVATVPASTVGRKLRYCRSSTPSPSPPSDGSLRNFFQRYTTFFFLLQCFTTFREINYFSLVLCARYTSLCSERERARESKWYFTFVARSREIPRRLVVVVYYIFQTTGFRRKSFVECERVLL